MKEMLVYYGYETLKEFGISVGLYNEADAERMLKEMYEEDILWDEA